MSRCKLFVYCLSAFLGLSTSFPTKAGADPVTTSIDDWPQIRGPQRDGRSAETGLLASWPEGGPRLVWRRPIGQGFSAVAAAGGRLFTMAADETTEYALALDPADGEEIWRTPMGEVFTNQFGDGPRSTPTVDADYVYVFSSRGRLAALSTDDGSGIWTVEVTETFGSEVPRFGYSASALIEGDLLLIETGGTDGKALAALDKCTGDVRWTALDGAAGYSSPVVTEIGGVRQIVFFRRAEPQIVSLLPDGKVFWTADGLEAVIHMPLLVPPDGIFISSTHAAEGFLLRIGMEGSEPVVEEAWRTPKMKNHFNTSVVVDGHIYGFDNAMLKSFDASTGQQNWAHRGLGKGSLIEAGGRLIVLSDAGEVALVEADPAGYVERGRFQGLEGKAWTAPTLAGGRLYLRDQDEIASYDLRATSGAARPVAPDADAEDVAARGDVPDVGDLDVDEVLRRYAKARGGLEQWRAVRGIETAGIFTSYSIREPFTLAQRSDGAFRFDTVMNGGRTVHGADGDGPWWIEPVFGLRWARRPPAPFAAQLRREWVLEPPLLDAAAKRHRAVLAGRGDVDGRPTLKIELTLASDAEETSVSQETWHLDPATFLEVAVDGKILDFTQATDPLDLRTSFADFRDVGGLMIPHRVEKEYLSRHTVLEIEEIRLDPPVDDSRFQKPLTEGMEALADLAGTWELEIETRRGEEQPWQSTTTTSTITSILDGALLEERFRTDSPSGPADVLRQYSWDPASESYRLIHVDDGTGSLLLFLGKLEDGKITATNESTGTTARRGDAERLERQVLSEIGPDGFRIEWEQSIDGGERWLTTIRYMYASASSKK